MELERYIAKMSPEERARKIVEYSNTNLFGTYYAGALNVNYNSYFLGIRSSWVRNLRIFLNIYNGEGDAGGISIIDDEVVESRINHFRNLLLQQHATITARPPALKCSSNDSNGDTLANIRKSDAWLEYLKKTKNFDSIISKAALYAGITGSGILFGEWDPFEGEAETVDENNNLIFSGEPTLQASLPMFFYGTPGVADFKKLPFGIHTSFENKCDYIARYPEFADEIENWSGSDAWYISNGLINCSASDHLIPVRKYFHRRINGYLPKGQHSIVLGDNILVFDGENPYASGPDCNDLPFWIIKPIDRPDTFWGQTLADDMVAPQEMYDAVLSGVSTKIAMFGLPSLAGQSASVNQLSLPGGMNYFQFSGDQSPPQVLDLLNIKEQEISILNLFEMQMEKILAISPVRRGQNPNDLKSGVAIKSASVEGIEFQNPFFKSYYDAYKDIGTFHVRLPKLFNISPRTISTMSKNDAPQFTTVSGEDMGEGGTVYIEPVDPSTITIGGRQNIAQMYASQGILPPSALEYVRKYGRLPDEWQSEEKQRLYVRDENELLKQGIDIAVDEFDNDELHLQEHAQLIEDAKLRLASMSGEQPGAFIYALIKNHMDTHRRNAMMKARPPIPPQAMQPATQQPEQIAEEDESPYIPPEAQTPLQPTGVPAF